MNHSILSLALFLCAILCISAQDDSENTNSNGRLCPAGEIFSPAPGTTWQLQLTGNIDTSIDVQFIDIDMFDNDASTIAALHESGVAVSCYFSSQYENWRPDSASFTTDILGNALDDWPGENWVDIRSDKLRSILTARMDIAVQKGCDAIDIDNVDEYQANNGLDLTADDQLEFNIYLAQQAHARGLSVGLKNDLDQIPQLVSYFDWSLNEQCNEYGECASLSPFVENGKAVFGVEYNEEASQFCPTMKDMQFSFLQKTLDLSAGGTQCCSSTGGCSGAQYTCVSAESRRSAYGVEKVNNIEEAPVRSAASYVVVPAALMVAAVALAF